MCVTDGVESEGEGGGREAGPEVSQPGSTRPRDEGFDEVWPGLLGETHEVEDVHEAGP